MPSVYTALKAYLKTKAPIVAVLGDASGDGTRIYSVAPRQAPLPFLVLRTFSGYSDECLDGSAGSKEVRVQVDAYGADEEEAYDLHERVRRAPLQGYRGPMGGLGCMGVSSDDSERTGVENPQDATDTTRRWWVSRDYQIAVKEDTAVYV